MHDQEYMTIGLSQGKETLVDAEDFEELSKHVWSFSNNGYAIRNEIVNGKQGLIRMHRVIMDPPSDLEIDHINGNKLDNRKENLRICTRSENLRNQGMRKNNQSGYKGVSKQKKDKKWTVQIKFEGKKIHIGRYKNKHAAARAYNEKAIELFQEFAWINQVRDGNGNFPIKPLEQRRLFAMKGVDTCE